MLRWAYGCAVGGACAGVLDLAAAGAVVERLRDGAGAGSEQAVGEVMGGGGATDREDDSDIR